MFAHFWGFTLDDLTSKELIPLSLSRPVQNEQGVQKIKNMNTFTMLLLAGFGVVSGIGLGLAASPIAKLARYMHDADHVSRPTHEKPDHNSQTLYLRLVCGKITCLAE